MLPLTLSAQGVTDRYIAPRCEQTPLLSTSDYPGYSRVMSHNRLALPPGKSAPAEGQLVYLYGRVFDRNCVPVSEASVEIWQRDATGAYRFITPSQLATPEPAFSGAGRIRTDNLGQFHFLTLYPGTVGRLAPQIQVRISHPSLRTFTTRLYFSGDYRNDNDPSLSQMSNTGRELVTMLVMPRQENWQQGIQVYTDIVLPQTVPFRKF
tara:strand:- start:78 stop:701 length:624 start_codon:yes stop_codon:yes gene_type:complete